jgi:hypothetical protein
MKARGPRPASLTLAAAGCLLLLWSLAAPADPEAAKPPAVAAADAPASTASATPAPAAPPPASTVIELPALQPGLWEYRRTVVNGRSAQPQVSTTRKCSNPSADMHEKMEQLRKKNCQFAPLRQVNDHYISSWICQTPAGAMRFRDVLTVKDPASYQDVSETHSPQHVSQQKIEAIRLGECPGLGAAAPRTPARKPTHP